MSSEVLAPPTRARRVDLGLVLVAAWSLISLGNAQRYGTYRPLAISLLGAGVLLLSWAVLGLASTVVRPPSRLSLLLAVLVAAVSTAVSPAERYARGAAAGWSHGLLLAAALGLLVLAVRREPLRWVHWSVLVVAAAAGVAGIQATPRPSIDDWHILQGSARALLHLHNIYGHAWPGSQGHLLPYLPGSALLVTPFYLAFSDVRYGLLTSMVLAAIAVAGLKRSANTATVAVLSGLVVVYPWVLYGVEQSWPEPLLLAQIAGMVWAVQRKHCLLAVICLSAALVTKQHALILLPFAAVWPAFGWKRSLTSLLAAIAVTLPWVLLSPQMFWRGAVTYNLNLAPRHDSLSLFTTASRLGWTPSFALVPLVMVVVLALGLWRLPRTATGFVLGSAWLLAMFNLLNKQSFFNEWSLVIGLIVLGLATMAAAQEPTRQEPPR